MEIDGKIKSVATDLLELKVKLDTLTIEIDKKKEMMREFAGDESLDLIIEGKGKIRVTKPREVKVSTITTVDIDKLNSIPDLKAKLLDKGILKEEKKVGSAAKASVIIEVNV